MAHSFISAEPIQTINPEESNAKGTESEKNMWMTMFFALLSSGFMVSIGSADIKECAISFSGQRHAVATASAPYLSCIEIMVSNSHIVLLMSLLIRFRIFLYFRLYLLK